MEIYFLAKNNLIRSLKHKTRFLVGFLLPILLCLLAGFINTGIKGNIRVGVIENEMLVKQLEQTEGMKAQLADQATYHTDLIMGKYHVVIGENNAVISVGNSKKKMNYETMLEALTEGESSNSNDSPQSKEGTITQEERSMAFLMTLFLIMATINAAVMIKDKKMGTYNRCLQIIPRGFHYVIGNYIYNFLVTLLQVSISLILMTVLVKNTSLGIVSGILLSLFITLVATVFATVLCLICRSDVQANISASSIASLFSMIGGTFVAVSNMPVLLQYLSVISPVRWVIELSRIL